LSPIAEIPPKFLFLSDGKGVYPTPRNAKGFKATALGGVEMISGSVIEDHEKQFYRSSVVGSTNIPLTPPPSSTRKVDTSNSRIRSYSLSHAISAPRDQQHQHPASSSSHLPQFQPQISFGRCGNGMVVYGRPGDSVDSAGVALSSSSVGAVGLGVAGGVGVGVGVGGAATMAMNIASSAPAAGSQLKAHHHTGHGGRRRTTSSNSNG